MDRLGPVAVRCIEVIGHPCLVGAEYAEPPGYRSSLALCIIDAIQSTGVRYSSVVRVVNRYRAARAECGADANTDGAPELEASFDAIGGVDPWATRIGTRNRVSTHPGAPLKAEAVRDAARVLRKAGIETTEDFRASASEEQHSGTAEVAWRSVAGQGSGVTWHYARILAGVPGVKPDRMILRFVSDALQTRPDRITTANAIKLVSDAAAELGVSATALDHAIWRFQRKRR